MKALALAISCLCLPGGPAFAEPRETPPAADTAAGIGDAQKRWTLNQQNADLREFIAQIAAITGESFVIDPPDRGHHRRELRDRPAYQNR